MTTNIDNRENRDASETWNDGLEYTQGVPGENNYDPNGAYPKIEYTFGFSINNGATGAETHELDIGGGIRGRDLELSPVRPSVYPYNQVKETPFGHVISIDDTPGGERILIKHGKGHGVELRPDGSVVISSKNNTVQVTDGNSTVIVKGETNLVYEGNLNLDVTGDMNLNIGGDYNVRVNGQNNSLIKGSEYHRTEGNASKEILQNNALTVIGDDVHAVMSTKTDIVNKEYEFIGDDDIIFNTSKDIKVSAENDIAFSADNFATVSQSVGILADKGTIGGENTEHFGKTFSGPANGTGTETTFYGTLIGLAHEAVTSQYAIWARGSWFCDGVARYAITAEHLSNIPSGLPTPGCFAEIPTCPQYEMTMDWNQNNPEWRMPTKSIVTAIQQEMDKGTKKPVVWDGNIIARTTMYDQYQVIFKSKPTIQEIRIAMRDKCVRESEIPEILVAQNLLHKDYATATPTQVENAADANATSRFGVRRIGNSTELTETKFKVRK